MDRRVTIRFYQLEAVGTSGLSLEDAFASAMGRRLPDREIDVGDGICMRLEDLNAASGILTGDFTRVQTENLPSHPTENSTDPLPIERLGHHTAFCYDPTSKIIAMQYDQKLTVGRLCQYAAAFALGKSFAYFPVLKRDALERFEEETPIRLKVRVAKVAQFAAFRETSTDFERAIEEMGALFDAPIVEITLSSRGADGGLDKERVGETVRRMLGFRERFGGIRSIIAETNETPDPFNFIKDLLRRTETLDLPTNDPSVARSARVDFARRCINDELDYIRAVYGQVAASQ